MDFILGIYRQILNLIKNLLVAFGVDTEAVDNLINNADKADKAEETV